MSVEDQRRFLQAAKPQFLKSEREERENQRSLRQFELPPLPRGHGGQLQQTYPKVFRLHSTSSAYKRPSGGKHPKGPSRFSSTYVPSVYPYIQTTRPSSVAPKPYLPQTPLYSKPTYISAPHYVATTPHYVPQPTATTHYVPSTPHYVTTTPHYAPQQAAPPTPHYVTTHYTVSAPQIVPPTPGPYQSPYIKNQYTAPQKHNYASTPYSSTPYSSTPYSSTPVYLTGELVNANEMSSQIVMLSGCSDSQTSADVSGTVQANGACTSALIHILRTKQRTEDFSWAELLRKMQWRLKYQNFKQIPQLSSSKNFILQRPVSLGANCTKKRHALLIGINYTGSDSSLKGCHNDVMEMKTFLIERENFRESDFHILLDKQGYEFPTRKNILAAFQRLTRIVQPGDFCFLQYSGHGISVADDSDTEEDGKDESLVPCDYKRAGYILDDDIMRQLTQNLARGSRLAVLVDCCHSGTVLDLPFVFRATDSVSPTRN